MGKKSVYIVWRHLISSALAIWLLPLPSEKQILHIRAATSASKYYALTKLNLSNLVGKKLSFVLLLLLPYPATYSSTPVEDSLHDWLYHRSTITLNLVITRLSKTSSEVFSDEWLNLWYLHGCVLHVNVPRWGSSSFSWTFSYVSPESHQQTVTTAAGSAEALLRSSKCSKSVLLLLPSPPFPSLSIPPSLNLERNTRSPTLL